MKAGASAIFAKAMMRLITLFLLLSHFWILGQGQNPFDIGVPVGAKSHQDTSNQKVSVQKHQSSDNPFDLNYRTRRSENSVQQGSNHRAAENNNNFVGETKSQRDPVSELVVLLYSILMLVALTIAITINRRRFAMIMRSFVNSNHLKNLYKDHRAWTEIQSFILYGLFFSNTAFLLGLLSSRLMNNALPALPTVLITVILIYVIRHAIMWIISYVYELDIQVGQHNYSIGLHNMILGVLMIPFIIVFGFLPDDQGRFLHYVLLLVVSIVYISRQAKGLHSALSMRGFNLFYFFIYLCAIEIAPFLVAWKVVSGAL